MLNLNIYWVSHECNCCFYIFLTTTLDMGLNAVRLEGKMENDNFFNLADQYHTTVFNNRNNTIDQQKIWYFGDARVVLL